MIIFHKIYNLRVQTSRNIIFENYTTNKIYDSSYFKCKKHALPLYQKNQKLEF